MSNLLPFDNLSSGNAQQTTPKKSLAYFLGLRLGKVVVSARHQLSGFGQAIHHRIENDVEKRLAEQDQFHDISLQQQERAHCEQIELLKRRHLKITIAMTLIGLLIGTISTTILFWYN